jgi:hypothetical protein
MRLRAPLHHRLGSLETNPRFRAIAAVSCAIFTSLACIPLDVGNLNGPGIDDIETNPTRDEIAGLAVGMLITAAEDFAQSRGYVSLLGIVGRESYNLDESEPRLVTELLIGPLSGGSVGGFLWPFPYVNIREGNIILDAVGRVPDMTPEEINATIGYTQTMQALAFLRIVNTTDTAGAPINVGGDPRGDPAPVATKAAVFTHVINLLDSAQAHLAAGGDRFPFQLSLGFQGFDAPSSFVKFNRALRARVAVYQGDFGGAMAALDASFLDPGGSFASGVYLTGNGLDDPTGRFLLAHPSIESDVQVRADGTPDLRLQLKVRRVDPVSFQGITSDLAFTMYETDSELVPIIRNEELVLLRAEARLGEGDLTGAVADLNLIRERSGGLPPYAGPLTPDGVLDELLYNRRYSLLFEGGHRWIDLRRYGRLNALPLDHPEHRRFDRFPFPQDDCDAYSPPPVPGCERVVGF